MRFKSLYAVVFSILAALVLADVAQAASIKTAAFENGAAIPVKHTCDGENVSPRIVIEGVPAEAKSLVIIVDDPDAPMGTWNHWILYDIPADTAELPEGYRPSGGAKEGISDFHRKEYGGPCPPPGPAHRYYFRLYAVSKSSLGLPEGAAREKVEEAARAAAVKGFPVMYMGTYKR